VKPVAAAASNAFEAEDFWANVSVVFGAIESSVKAKPVGTAGDDAFSHMSCRIFTKQ
jgi:hypothetical protein